MELPVSLGVSATGVRTGGEAGMEMVDELCKGGENILFRFDLGVTCVKSGDPVLASLILASH